MPGLLGWLIFTAAVVTVVLLPLLALKDWIERQYYYTGDAIEAAGRGQGYSTGVQAPGWSPDTPRWARVFVEVMGRLEAVGDWLLGGYSGGPSRPQPLPKVELITGVAIAGGGFLLFLFFSEGILVPIAVGMAFAGTAIVAMPLFGIRFEDLWRFLQPRLEPFLRRVAPLGENGRGLFRTMKEVFSGLSAKFRPPSLGTLRRAFFLGGVFLGIGAAIAAPVLMLSDVVPRPGAGASPERGDWEGVASVTGGAAVDETWLLKLARAWFTYDGLDSWLNGLEPYLVPRATAVIRECIGEQGALAWRLARTSIVEGPQVEVVGMLGELGYGALRLAGDAVHHPEVLRLYGIDLQPHDLGVRFSAVVVRQLPADKASLPGTDILTRPERVTVQFFIVDRKAIPVPGECGRGVAFVG